MGLFSLLIGVGILLLLVAIFRGIVNAEPRTLVKGLRWAAIIAGGAFALWLVVSGRLAQAIMMVMALAPLFMRWKALWNTMRNAAGPARGQSSDVETAWLRMALDHDTGAMDGTVLQGRRKGQRLSELSMDSLLELLAECRVTDPDGAQLIEAYLERARPDWRETAGASRTRQDPSASSAMTRDEAYRVLGLEPGADETAVREAHRRLMMKMHPDTGGSNYLAAKINQAKDLLLGA